LSRKKSYVARSSIALSTASVVSFDMLSPHEKVLLDLVENYTEFGK